MIIMIEKLTELEDKEWPFSNETQKVDQGEWAYSEGEPIEADYVGSCVAIGSIDFENREGYLFHIGTLNEESLDKYLEEAFEIVSSGLSEERRTYIVGTLPIGSKIVDNEPSFENVRSKALENLENYGEKGVSQFDQDFRQEKIAIDPENGDFYHQIK